MAEVDGINSAYTIMKRNDELYDSLFKSLTDSLENLEDVVKPDDRLKSLMVCEWVVFRLRTKLTQEFSVVRRIVSVYSEEVKSPKLLGKFKSRVEYLASMITRVNEITNDMNLMQRTLYSANTKIY